MNLEPGLQEQKGVARIKPAYILSSNKLDSNEESIAELSAGLEESTENKRLKLENGEPAKQRGQNKHRPRLPKPDKATKLCPSLLDIAEDEKASACQYGERCQFTHNVEEYLKNKPADLAGECYVFKKYGKCPRGVACRFGSEHLTSDGKNIVVKEKWDPEKFSKSAANVLPHDLQILLRKKKYSLEKSESLVKEQNKKPKQPESGAVTDGKMAGNVEAGDRLGPVSDEDVVKLRQEEKRKIDWKGKLYLAPLTTVGNLPFRRICKTFGADITCGEMAMAQTLLEGGRQEWALVRRHESEDLFGVQVCGNNPFILTKCAQLLEEQISMDFMDINCGCPIDLVYEKGAGSGLMGREKPLTASVDCISKILSCPLTVKMRTGIHTDKNFAHKLIPKIKDLGVSMVTLHGRTREQRYTKLADWDYIEECAKIANPVPIFGNGDILSYEDYKIRMKSGAVSGVMIARGALIKPWIFQEIKEQRHIDISSRERFDILKEYTNYGLEHWGSDSQGVETTRRFILEWTSFLHRYIPVGLLETLPQKINDRPPPFKGRDDLETMMASPNCADWIKISEMLLGPVPDDFVFLPKHKANSWK